MIQPTPDVTAQLTRVKHTFLTAKTFAVKDDPSNRIIATILMDYVAESALKTVYWSHPKAVPAAEDVKFGQLLKKVAALAEGTPNLPLQVEIANLYAQRNLTQHCNLIPSAEDVPKNAAYIEAFLRDLCASFFGVDFDVLTLSTLVRDEELRRHLIAAERHAADRRYVDAVYESALALSKALLGADELLKLTQSWFTPTFMKFDAEQAGFSRPEAELLGDLAGALVKLRDDLEERIRVLALGLDYSSYMRYKAVAPFVYWTLDGAVHVNHRRKNYSAEEAASVFDYALNQILRLEAVGALPGPADEE